MEKKERKGRERQMHDIVKKKERRESNERKQDEKGTLDSPFPLMALCEGGALGGGEKSTLGSNSTLHNSQLDVFQPALLGGFTLSNDCAIYFNKTKIFKHNP